MATAVNNVPTREFNVYTKSHLTSHTHDVITNTTTEIADVVNVDEADRFGRTALMGAAETGDCDVINDLILRGAVLNTVDIRGDSALGIAAWYNQYSVARLLLQNGADVNLSNETGETPLHRACSRASVETVLCLLADPQCNVNAKTNPGHFKPQYIDYTPLMLALPTDYLLDVEKVPMSRIIQIVQTLLTHGADVNAVNSHGETALLLCTAPDTLLSEYTACVLMEVYADAETITNNDTSPLESAFSCQNFDVAKFIMIYNHINIRVTDLNRWHISRYLDYHNMQENFDPLTFTPQLPTSSTRYSNTLQNECRVCIRKLLHNNIPGKLQSLALPKYIKSFICLNDVYPNNIDPIDNFRILTSVVEGEMLDENTLSNVDPLFIYNGMNLLGSAVCSKNIHNIRLIVENYSDTKVLLTLDKHGQTPMHYASALNNVDVIDLLVNNYGFVDVINSAGQTPFLSAVITRSHDVIDRLCAHGCDVTVADNHGYTALNYIIMNADHELVQNPAFRPHLPKFNSLTSTEENQSNISTRQLNGVLYHDLVKGLSNKSQLILNDLTRKKDDDLTQRLLIKYGVNRSLVYNIENVAIHNGF